MFARHKVKRSMCVEINKKKMVTKVSFRETRGGEILKHVVDRLRRYSTKESGNVQRRLVFQVYKIIRPTIGESAYKGRLWSAFNKTPKSHDGASRLLESKEVHGRSQRLLVGCRDVQQHHGKRRVSQHRLLVDEKDFSGSAHHQFNKLKPARLTPAAVSNSMCLFLVNRIRVHTLNGLNLIQSDCITYHMAHCKL